MSSLVFSNLLILIVILFFVIQNPKPTSIKQSTLANAIPGTGSTFNPLDQLSSANIALTVARINSLPETIAINNQAQSEAADMAATSSGGNVLSKPQAVTTDLKSKADIKSYTTKDGDTLSGLASQFGVTSDSIRWSNNLTTNIFKAGTKLTIPPVNGIVYTVSSGDTADSLATKYKANRDQIIAYNDAEITGLQVGSQIIIPSGSIAIPTFDYFSIWGGPTYGSNGYDYGYCTWYVANKVSIPSNWGNASTWAYYAALSGWTVSSSPSVGAIAQTRYAAGGEGHVAVVEAIDADGTIWISEMNSSGQASMNDESPSHGWGHVDWKTVSASHYEHYITR
jgi:surface antigen